MKKKKALQRKELDKLWCIVYLFQYELEGVDNLPIYERTKIKQNCYLDKVPFYNWNNKKLDKLSLKQLEELHLICRINFKLGNYNFSLETL